MLNIGLMAGLSMAALSTTTSSWDSQYSKTTNTFVEVYRSLAIQELASVESLTNLNFRYMDPKIRTSMIKYFNTNIGKLKEGTEKGIASGLLQPR